MCNVTGHPTNCEPSSEYATHYSNHEFEAVNVKQKTATGMEGSHFID